LFFLAEVGIRARNVTGVQTCALPIYVAVSSGNKSVVPRGTTDLLPEDTATWQYAERILKSLCESYNYKEIRTPLFEHTEVFQRRSEERRVGREWRSQYTRSQKRTSL